MAVIITGGSKGIGRAIATRFAASAERVIINYSSDDAAADATAEQVRAAGGHPVLVKQDISTPDGLDAFVEAAIDRSEGGIAQLVHGAVYPFSADALSIPRETFERCVFLNGSALLYLVQGLVGSMSPGGTVCFLSSRGANVAVPNYVGVGAPKALAESLIRYLAVELAPRGIRVNSVSFSGVATDAFKQVFPDWRERVESGARDNPSGRMVVPDDVANAVHWLASEEAAMINGRQIVIDGGLYAKPG